MSENRRQPDVVTSTLATFAVVFVAIQVTILILKVVNYPSWERLVANWHQARPSLYWPTWIASRYFVGILQSLIATPMIIWLSHRNLIHFRFNFSKLRAKIIGISVIIAGVPYIGHQIIVKIMTP